ncbi:MAG TPA: efflux RND transporter periplasmic adaptor subunit [Dongiaceae bacterium]|nr:efflux RND transporter periplasmic adaptor subunit [Dongiaceae bacterium]
MSQKKWIWIAAAVLLALLGAWRWMGHSATEAEDAQESGDAVTVAVARVQRGPMDNALTIAGEFKPFQDVDVHAKVAGYIRKIYVDVGDHVKQGQTLAILEVPELAAQLAGADAAVRRAKEEIRREQGDVQRAESAHGALHAMFTRLSQASEQQKGLVAQQEVDDARAKDLESEAQVSSAQAALSAAQQQLEMAEANQKQYSAMTDYTRIVAPFTGVVTTRYADTGSLVAAGTSSSTQAIPVVRIAEVSKLRLVLPIPESMAAQIHLGDPVTAHVQALHQDITGKVSRFADSLDLQTRTMQTEIDFENRDGKLIPGMFTETRLVLAQQKDALAVPLEAVTQSGGEATVLVVNAQSTLEERKIKLGMQGKSRVQVLAGLSDGERVVIGNRSQYRNGQKVVAKEIAAPAGSGGAS